jgi:uncharacterized protein (TIGR03435 family)
MSCQSFDVADIKVNKSGPGPTSAKLINGQARVVNAPMRLLISAAFNVTPMRVTGGPGWLDSDRFDLAAKGSPDATEDQLREMLKSLLMDRVKLKAHIEERPTAVYALTMGKGGHKMKESTPANPTDQKCGQGEGSPEQIHMKCEHLTMSDLAKMLPGMAPRYITLPVVDKTELKGLWEFQLDWTPMAAPDGHVDDSGPTIETLGGLTMFDAIAKIGLKLDRAKLPVPFVVVDSVERIPVDN